MQLPFLLLQLFAVHPPGTPLPAGTQPGRVLSVQKISETRGGFGVDLVTNDQLGRSVCLLGDLDGDGIQDIAVGAQGDDDGGPNRGAFYVLFLRRDGTVRARQKVSSLAGGFTGNLSNGDQFARALCSPGDVDGDGVSDLAVGANLDDDGGDGKGAVWILFLRTDGTVASHQKISALAGDFTGELDVRDEFGRSCAALGDLDLDGVPDLAVGASYDDDGGQNRGAIYVLFLRPDGTVKSHRKISSTQGGFTGELHDFDYFAHGLGSMGDFDGDGTGDLIVGAILDDDANFNAGAAWLLFMNRDGTVKGQRKISSTTGFTGQLDERDQFGVSVSGIGDIDGNRTTDVAIGAVKDDDGGGGKGAVWIVFLSADGSVIGHQKISDTQGGFAGRLDNFDWFGSSVAGLGDLDLDGRLDIVAGARYDDDGGPETGAVYNLFLDGQEPMGPPPELVPYGSGINPAGSLVVLAGLPIPGTSVTFGIDNPLGTQPIGSAPWLVVALAPAGMVLPGLGMTGPGAPGELLVDLGRVDSVETGPSWNGPGNPAPITVPVPDEVGLIGISVYVQGVMFDVTPSAEIRIGLAEALEVRIGL